MLAGLLAVPVSLYVALRDPFIQTYAARTLAGFLSKELNTKITVGGFFFDLDLTLTVKDIEVLDQQNQLLLKAGIINFSIASLYNIKEKLNVNHLKMNDVDVRLVRYKGESDLNLQFIIDYFSKSSPDTERKSVIDYTMRLSRFSLQNASLCYQIQDYMLEDSIGIDYNNLFLSDINLKSTDVRFRQDTVFASIAVLQAKEKSGFVLDHLGGDLTMASQYFALKALNINAENSSLEGDIAFHFNDIESLNNFIEEVRMEVDFKSSSLQLADLGYFAPIMFDMPNLIRFSGSATGTVADFATRNFNLETGNSTRFSGDVKMKGLPDFFTSDIELSIRRLTADAADVRSFKIPVQPGNIVLPETLNTLGTIELSGMFKGSWYDFITRIDVNSKIGRLHTDLVMRTHPITGKSTYKGSLRTKQLDLGKLLENNTLIGKVNMNVQVDGKGMSIETAEVQAIGKINTIELLGNVFQDISLNGALTSKMFDGRFSVDDQKLQLLFNGLADLTNGQPIFDFDVNVLHADLHALHLVDSDSVMNLSTRVKARFTGLNLDNFLGDVGIYDLNFQNSRGLLKMKSLLIQMLEDPVLERKLTLNSEYLKAELGGVINLENINNSFRLFLHHYFGHEMLGVAQRPIVKDQDFYFNIQLIQLNPLLQLLIPNVSIANKAGLSGVFTSRLQMLNATFRADWLNISGVKFQNPYLLALSNQQEAKITLNIGDLLLYEEVGGDSTNIGIEQTALSLLLRNDSVYFDLGWNNLHKQIRNNGKIRGDLNLINTNIAELVIRNADVIVNDSNLTINQNHRIVFAPEYTLIDNFRLQLGNSSLALNGNAPVKEADTLQLAFHQWSISTFDLLIKPYGIDIDGFINGDLSLANLTNNPTFFSNLHISDLKLNRERMGEARLISTWSNLDESVYLNAQIINTGNIGTSRMLNLTGFYYPNRIADQLAFQLNLENFRLKFLNQFLTDVASKVEGFASGELTIRGSLKKPEFKGRMALNRTSFKVDYLNVAYSVQHEFEVLPDRILVNNLVLMDTVGNRGVVNGLIHHRYLNDFQFDIRIRPDNLLALNTGPQHNELFYGAAVATGEVLIRGPLNNIEMAIRAISQRGTGIVIPINMAASVGSNDYITFVKAFNGDIQEEGFTASRPSSAMNFGINLETVITPDASLRIYMPFGMGTLDARGNGNLSMWANAAGDFTLNGDYTVQSGQFNFTYENLPRKRFDLLDGGRISWAGDPYDALIDVKGVYKVKASLSGLGLDTTSSLRNRVNVDCIIHLTDQLFTPNIRFSFRFPGLDSQLEQTVFSIIDTTNDAMMTQQMISLLVLGSFSYTGADNFSIGNSSLDVLSGQLSGWLSQISKDFDIGLHYRPGDRLTSEELEVALSTQLFNDRVTIDGNFGVLGNRNVSQNASNIVGDVEVSVKLTSDGRFRMKAFNHSNINNWLNISSYDNLSPYTQGIGLSYRQEFDSFADLIRKRRKIKMSLNND